MKSLLANLRHLYQNREIWGWYFIIALSTWLIFLRTNMESPSSLNYGFASPILVLGVIGCALGRLTADIWTKPVFFCLPRQTKTSRSMLLLLGFITAMATSLGILILFPWMTSGVRYVLIFLVSFYLLFFLLAVIASILFNKIALFIICAFFFLNPILSRLGLWYDINNILLNHPWASTFVCIIACCLIYYALGTRPLARYICGATWLNYFLSGVTSGSDIVNPMRQKQNSLMDKFTGLINNFISKFIMRNNIPLIPRYFCCRLYVILGTLFSYWRMLSFIFISFFLCACIYANRYNSIDLQPYFFSLFAVMGSFICIIPKSEIYLPISRKMRFFYEISAIIIIIFITLAFAMVFILFSKIIPSNFIILMITPQSSNYISFNIKNIFFIVILLPIACGLLIIFPKKPFLFIPSITLIAASLLFGYFHFFNSGDVLKTFNLSVVILTTVVSFGFYMAVIYYDSMKRPLF